MSSDEINNDSWIFLFLAWIVALIATLGSLFFSEIMEFVPCTLCWYQRILMYPLVVIFFMGMFPYDKQVVKFAFPLVLLGWLVALYHNLIHYEIIPESASPCVQGIPCSTKYIQWLGFLTIPMMSFIAFSLIGILLYTIKIRKV